MNQEVEVELLAGTKRKRYEDLCVENLDSVKVQKTAMDKKEMIELLDSLKSSIVGELSGVIKEVKKDVEDLAANLKMMHAENQVLKEQICCLRINGRAMKKRIEDLEIKAAEKNLILKNVNIEEDKNLIAEVEKICKQKMAVDVKVEDVLRLKVKNNETVFKMIFSRRSDVVKILRAKHKLKGSNIIIHKDLPMSVREKRAKMFRLKDKWKQAGLEGKFFVKENYFVLENKKYLLEEDKIYEGVKDVTSYFSEKLKVEVTAFLRQSVNRQQRNDEVQMDTANDVL